MSSLIDKENDKRFVLPNSLRGKNINSEKIIPTVCNVKIMLDKLKEKSGEYSSLEQWEKRSYINYNIEEIKNELLLAGEEDRIKILRRQN